MPTRLITANIDPQTSSEVTLSADQTAFVFLAEPADTLKQASYADIQLKASDSDFSNLVRLRWVGIRYFPVTGPVTFRVVGNATTEYEEQKSAGSGGGGGGGGPAVDFEIALVQDANGDQGLLKISETGSVSFVTLTGAPWTPVQPVKAVANNSLPTGASTSALQTALNAGIGSPTDAAAGQGAEGTVSAKLRTVTSLLNSILFRFPASLGGKTAAASMSVTTATDDPMVSGLGAQADAPAAAAGATASLISLIKYLNAQVRDMSLKLPASLGGKTAATSLSITTATDDPSIAVLGTAADAIASAGGTGTLSAKLRLATSQLGSIISRLPAALGVTTAAGSLSVVPASDANVARETYTTVTILNLATSATGANFVVFGSQACSSLDVINSTAVDIELRRGGTGSTLTILAGQSRLIQGITNANAIQIRRKDQGNTPVTVEAEAFAI